MLSKDVSVHRNSNHSSFSIILGGYLIVSCSVLPLMSPLRVMRIGDPIFLRYFFNPIVVLLLGCITGKGLRPRTDLQFVLIFVFLQAAAVGFLNSQGIEPREYLAHLFQPLSAYVMFSVGMSSNSLITERFWRFFSWISLLSYFAATAFTIYLMGSGGLGGFCTPAYVLLLPIAFFSVYARGKGLFSFLISFLSNKRGVIFAGVAMLMPGFAGSARTVRQGVKRNALLCFSIFAAVFILLKTNITKVQTDYETDNAVKRVTMMTSTRIVDLFSSNSDIDFDTASSGRMEEINSALRSMDEVSWAIGNGAGWHIPFNDNYVGHIHFSPLCLAAVFGLPFTLYLYFFAAWVAINGTRTNTVPLLRVSVLYVIGAFVHSFTAYSLFIDPLVFFFLGAAGHHPVAIRLRKSRATLG